MTFRTFTKPSGKLFDINLANVEIIEEGSDGTTLITMHSGRAYSVTEAVDEVRAMMEPPNHAKR